MSGFVAVTWWQSSFLKLYLLCEVAWHQPTLVTFVPVVSQSELLLDGSLQLQLARKNILLILSLLSYKSTVFLTISNMILLRYTFFMEKSERPQGKSFSAEMNDVWPFPEQQLFIFFCREMQGHPKQNYVMLHYSTILLQTGGEMPDPSNSRAFYLSPLCYISPQEIHPYS